MLGFKISLPGFDADTAPPEKLVLSSEYPSPKIKVGVTPRHFDVIAHTFTSDPPNGTNNLYTIAHGYGYTPASMLYVFDNSSNRQTIAPYYVPGIGFLENQSIVALADSSAFYINYYCDNQGSPGHVNVNGRTFTIKYYIFAEDGA
jgi:hypothetical protein